MRDNIKGNRYSLASRLLNLLYPSACPLCKKHSDSYSHSPVCTDCWNGINRYSGPSCGVCATPLVSEYSSVCGECMKNTPPFSIVLNYGIYSGALAAAIHHLKFFGIRRLARPLASLLQELCIPECDGIIPVPLSKKGLMERGFNQSVLVAKALAKKTNMPLYADVLVKKKDTPPQVGLSAKERMKNLKGAFEVKGNIRDKRLLLFDDVMTTGATARECSGTLIKAGAREVIVITLARSAMM